VKVIITRGPPGSGKSSWIENTYPGELVCSADHGFIGPDGVYRHDMSRLKEVHDQCLRKFTELVITGKVPLVIVDNTHIQRWEMTPYVALSRAYGYEVEFHTFMVDPRDALARNRHGASWEVILRSTMEMESPLMTWGRQFLHLPDGVVWAMGLRDPEPGS
jgi:NEDD4-binding protein 2